MLVIAGQHGDEPLTTRAVERLADLRDGPISLPDGIDLSVIPDANPDAHTLGQRRNADGIDLNRDHQHLSSPEVLAIHEYVRAWRPHLIFDVHTYPARRKHLVRQGLAYRHDVFLDYPNHPAIDPGIPQLLADSLLPAVIGHLRGHGFLCDRYTLVRRSGRIRHSTPDLVDARNGLALRFGVPTLLIEGRQPSRRDRIGVETRTVSAIRHAIGHALRWAVAHRDELAAIVDEPRQTKEVALGCHYVFDDPPPLPFADSRTGEAIEAVLSGPYLSTLRPNRVVPIPRAYAIAPGLDALVELLGRHGITGSIEHRRRVHATRYRIAEVRRTRHPRRSIRPIGITAETGHHDLRGHRIVPVTRETARFLAALLEPRSKFGAVRDLALGLLDSKHSYYSISNIDR